MFFCVSQKRVHPLLPFGIMGINALIAGLLCMTLPETRNQPILETFEKTDTKEKANELLVRENMEEEKENRL